MKESNQGATFDSNKHASDLPAIYKFKLLHNVESNMENILRVSHILQIIRLKHKSSHQSCPVKKSVLKNYPKFTGKYLCQSLFLNKAAGFFLRICESLKKTFLQNSSERLLLQLTAKHVKRVKYLLILHEANER